MTILKNLIGKKVFIKIKDTFGFIYNDSAIISELTKDDTNYYMNGRFMLYDLEHIDDYYLITLQKY